MHKKLILFLFFTKLSAFHESTEEIYQLVKNKKTIQEIKSELCRFSIGKTDDNGNTLLHPACQQDNVLVTQALIDLHMNLYIENKFNQTPLDIAQLAKSENVLRLLATTMVRFAHEGKEMEEALDACKKAKIAVHNHWHTSNEKDALLRNRASNAAPFYTEAARKPRARYYDQEEDPCDCCWCCCPCKSCTIL